MEPERIMETAMERIKEELKDLIPIMQTTIKGKKACLGAGLMEKWMEISVILTFWHLLNAEMISKLASIKGGEWVKMRRQSQENTPGKNTQTNRWLQLNVIQDSRSVNV